MKLFIRHVLGKISQVVLGPAGVYGHPQVTVSKSWGRSQEALLALTQEAEVQSSPLPSHTATVALTAQSIPRWPDQGKAETGGLHRYV